MDKLLVATSATATAAKPADTIRRETSHDSHTETRPHNNGNRRNAYSLVPSADATAFSTSKNAGGATCAKSSGASRPVHDRSIRLRAIAASSSDSGRLARNRSSLRIAPNPIRAAGNRARARELHIF